MRNYYKWVYILKQFQIPNIKFQPQKCKKHSYIASRTIPHTYSNHSMSSIDNTTFHNVLKSSPKAIDLPLTCSILYDSEFDLPEILSFR